MVGLVKGLELYCTSICCKWWEKPFLNHVSRKQSWQSLFQIAYNIIACTTANKWPSRETLAGPVSGTCISGSKTYCDGLILTTPSWQDTRSGKVSRGQHKIIHCTLLSAKLWHFPIWSVWTMDDNGGALSHFHAPSLSRKALSRSLTSKTIALKTIRLQCGIAITWVSSLRRHRVAGLDLMLWKFQPVYLRSTDFLSEKKERMSRGGFTAWWHDAWAA